MDYLMLVVLEPVGGLVQMLLKTRLLQRIQVKLNEKVTIKSKKLR